MSKQWETQGRLTLKSHFKSLGAYEKNIRMESMLNTIFLCMPCGV